MESEAVKRWLEKRKKKTEPDDDFLIVLKSFIFLWSESSPAPLSRNRINTPGGTPPTEKEDNNHIGCRCAGGKRNVRCD